MVPSGAVSDKALESPRSCMGEAKPYAQGLPGGCVRFYWLARCIVGYHNPKCLMKHQSSLLIRSLHRDEAHARPGDGVAIRVSIRSVRFPALCVGLDVGRRHQFHTMSESRYL